MPKTKAEMAKKNKFLFSIKEIKRFSTQVAEAIENKSLKLIEKLKAELISLENELKKSYFGVAEETVNDLYESFTESKDIVVADLAKIGQFLENQDVKTDNENTDTANNSSRIGVNNNALKLPKFEFPIFYGDE